MSFYGSHCRVDDSPTECVHPRRRYPVSRGAPYYSPTERKAQFPHRSFNSSQASPLLFAKPQIYCNRYDPQSGSAIWTVQGKHYTNASYDGESPAARLQFPCTIASRDRAATSSCPRRQRVRVIHTGTPCTSTSSTISCTDSALLACNIERRWLGRPRGGGIRGLRCRRRRWHRRTQVNMPWMTGEAVCDLHVREDRDRPDVVKALPRARLLAVFLV
jgi:hypothetical protein